MTDLREYDWRQVEAMRNDLAAYAQKYGWCAYENREYRGAIERVQGIIDELRAAKQYALADKLRAAIELPQIRFTTPKLQKKGE